MLLSAVSVLVVAQSSSEIPEGLMNNPVYSSWIFFFKYLWTFQQEKVQVQLNEIREEQAEAVHQQDFMQAQMLLEKIKELQEELQRLDVVHEQV